MNCYIDTSALVKLLGREAESEALIDWLAAERPRLYGADLLRTELIRAVRKAAPELVGAARELLTTVVLIALASSTYTRAAELDPAILRSLDALHLSVALELGDDLDVLLTYDDRLTEAAHLYGIRVESPT